MAQFDEPWELSMTPLRQPLSSLEIAVPCTAEARVGAAHTTPAIEKGVLASLLSAH